MREKPSREKIKCRQTLQKHTLSNLIAGGGGTVPILRKNCHPSPLFPLINTSSQMKIFIPFYYNPRRCLPTVLSINNIYFCSSIRVQIVSAFLLTKSLLTKHKNYLLEAPYRTSETSNLELFTKIINGLQPKTIFAKSSSLNV